MGKINLVPIPPSKHFIYLYQTEKFSPKDVTTKLKKFHKDYVENVDGK